MTTLFSGTNPTNYTTAGDADATNYDYSTSATQSVDITTAPGDWVYSAWCISKPGFSTGYDFTTSHDKSYPASLNSITDPQLDQGLWTQDTSGNGNGYWSFQFGHQAASTVSTTTTACITVANSGCKYKWAGSLIRIPNKYPGGEVGDGGFLNGKTS